MTVSEIDQSVLSDIGNSIESHGFCVVEGALQASTAKVLRDLLSTPDRLIEEKDNAEYVSSEADQHFLLHKRVLALAIKHPAFLELMCHPLALEVCGSLLGGDFFCSTWSANILLPGFRNTYWHVDHPYWTIAPPYPTRPALTIHTIWCLDDFNSDSGGTMFIPGSHNFPHMPDHNQDCSNSAITIEAPRGSVIFAHGAIWHSAGQNSSNISRCAVFGRYARSFVVPQEDLRHQLSQLSEPSQLIRRLMGGEQYTPLRGLPY